MFRIVESLQLTFPFDESRMALAARREVGERSGELERMLERVADNYEREVSHSLSQMTTVLEPVMTLAMAAVIVFMMLAVLMPIFQLYQLMQ